MRQGESGGDAARTQATDKNQLSRKGSNSREKQAKRPREQWMDLLRGWAILLVIVLHGATVLQRAGIEPPIWLVDLSRLFVLFRMPSLVFLSGLLLAPSLRKPPVDYIYGKLQRIGWPLVIWSGIYMLVFQAEMSLASFADVLSGDSYLWFLGFILTYYALALVLRRVPALLIGATLLTAAVMAPDGEKFSERLLYLGALFYLGAWIGNHWREWKALIVSPWAPLALALASYFSLVMLARSELNYGPYDLFAAACFIVGASAVSFRLQGRRQLEPIAFVGRNSLQYYVVHYPIIFVCAKLSQRLGVSESDLIPLISIVVAIVGATVAVLLAQRYTIVQRLFVGPERPRYLLGRRPLRV